MIELQTMNEIPIYTIIKIEAEEALFPLDMAENLGMFDEIDPLSQISETDPRQWQMEWMYNYMDALEELEDSTTRE